MKRSKTYHFLCFSTFCSLLKQYPFFVLGNVLYSLSLSIPAYFGNVFFLKTILAAMINHEPIIVMFRWLLLLALILLLTDAYASFYVNIIHPKFVEALSVHFYQELTHIVEKSELSVYDDPHFHDDMTLAFSKIVDVSVQTVSYISRIASALINIVLILHLLTQLGFVILLIVLLSIISSIAMDVFIIKLQNEKKERTSSIDRRKQYFYHMFFSRASLLDRKMTMLSQLFEHKYDFYVSEKKKTNGLLGKRLFYFQSIRETISSHFLLYIVLFIFLLYESLVTRNLSADGFLASYNASFVLSSAILEVVQVWMDMKESAFIIRKYHSVASSLSDTIRLSQDRADNIQTIELKHIYFSYPGTDKNVLKDVNLTLRVGEKIAVIGENGSGKTTLVHILMGLYTPSKGDILVNGCRVTPQEYKAYRKKFATFFQGAIPFEATISENVALDVVHDTTLVHSALEQVGLERLAKVPPETMIGKLFDPYGIVLSGGENQKLLLSYCHYCRKRIIIMDEPAAAYDPAAELSFNNLVYNLSNNKLTILVSHRLSTVYMADRILVLNDGQIQQQGTHTELLEKDGIYKAMWTSQVKKYSL